MFLNIGGSASEIHDCLLKQLDSFPSNDLRDEILIETEKYLNQSDQIRFFQGHKEMKLPIGELQAGQTYTVIVHNNKLVLGKDIPGSLDGLIGGRGSHDTLTDYIKNHDKELFRPDSYDHKAGAIGIRNDGTIVVSDFITVAQAKNL